MRVLENDSALRKWDKKKLSEYSPNASTMVFIPLYNLACNIKYATQ